MPGDVAMERPYPGVIGIELQHQVPGLGPHPGLDQLRVSPLRVLQVHCAVPVADAFCQDPEIVAVEMHGVRGSGDVQQVPEYDADGAVGAEIVHVPLGVVGVGCVALICEQEEWVAVAVLVN